MVLMTGTSRLGERLRRLVAVELQRAEPALLGHRLDVAGRRDPRRRRPGVTKGGSSAMIAAAASGRDVARRALDEDEAERVGAGLDARARVLEHW